MHESTHVATVVLSAVTLLLIAAGTLLASRRSRIPFTVLLVVIGMVLSWLADNEPATAHLLHAFEFSPELILFVFLPTLLFESTFAMDGRQLRNNLTPILSLAVPGLLLSAFLIGGLVHLATSIPFSAALLLGAILSATDPVAVVSMFKHLGAPQRLTVLVEGESLFNDASAIVLAGILLGVVMAGTVSLDTIGAGVVDFFTLFIGGLLVGWGLAVMIGMVMGHVESDPLVEISMVTALAYLSFLVAEEVLGVSGVMATIGAALTMGTWGKMKISASVRARLDHFWQYLAFIANAMIFLLLGLSVNPAVLWSKIDTLIWVLLALLASRAILVFGMIPLARRLFGFERLTPAYSTIVFWGGLRGAIAIAIALSLPEFEYRELFQTLVLGAVLFTIMVQGLSIEPLMRKLHLDTPPLADRLAQLETNLRSQESARAELPKLSASGLLSPSVVDSLSRSFDQNTTQTHARVAALRAREMAPEQERTLVHLRALTEEKAAYVGLFNKGHLGEQSYRSLSFKVGTQIDALRFQSWNLPPTIRLLTPAMKRWVYRSLDRLPFTHAQAERLMLRWVILEYEQALAYFMATQSVLERLGEWTQDQEVDPAIIDEVQVLYELRHDESRSTLDELAGQYPHFVKAAQSRLCQRLVLLSELELLEQHAERGTLSEEAANHRIDDIHRQLQSMRSAPVSRLRVSASELVHRTEHFAALQADDREQLVRRLKQHSAGRGEILAKAGEPIERLILLARGVVSIQDSDGTSGGTSGGRVFSLMGGDIIGINGSGRYEATFVTTTPVTYFAVKYAELPETLKHRLGRVDDGLSRHKVDR